MSSIPTSLWLVVFAILAAVGGLVFSHRRSDQPNMLVSNILYAIAVACLVIAGWVTYTS